MDGATTCVVHKGLLFGAHATDLASRWRAGLVQPLFGAVKTAWAAPVGATTGPPIVMTDLRMGQTPWFVFSFIVAELGDRAVPCRTASFRCAPAGHALPWLWNRIWDEDATF